MKRIFSFNVNGIRSAIGKGLYDWIAKEKPDVLCLQELKAHEQQIPLMEVHALGYETFLLPAHKKGYSGVAIFTRIKPTNVEMGMNMDIYDQEGRFMRADFGQLSIVSVYHPSGTSGEERQAFKMKWLGDFLRYIENLRFRRPYLIIAGDFNIAHEEIDIHDPIGNANNSGFLPEEREWFTNFLHHQYVDTFRYLYPDKQVYSWWSFRFQARKKNKGWRIDYIIITPNLLPYLKDAFIHQDVEMSDHCPVSITFDWNAFQKDHV
ncbi:MAG: exodeoxyribonuclease III [Bacteroidales bacterium]|nr:exodeoxyribonuclease III [Bacteroidales bacterium]